MSALKSTIVETLRRILIAYRQVTQAKIVTISGVKIPIPPDLPKGVLEALYVDIMNGQNLKLSKQCCNKTIALWNWVRVWVFSQPIVLK